MRLRIRLEKKTPTAKSIPAEQRCPLAAPDKRAILKKLKSSLFYHWIGRLKSKLVVHRFLRTLYCISGKKGKTRTADKECIV